jgi:hypothetical protein
MEFVFCFIPHSAILLNVLNVRYGFQYVSNGETVVPLESHREEEGMGSSEADEKH